MGAAPLAGVGSCAAAGCGGCIAGGCCKLAFAGQTETTKAARCVLLWLQIIAVSMAAMMRWNPKTWLDGPCAELPDWGICDCYASPTEDLRQSCYMDQLTYRCEFSVVLLFVFLMILCVSGCAKHAAQDCPFGKFMILILLTVVLLFVPNTILTVFGQIAGVASAVFLAWATILLVDFAYTWNEGWHSKAIARQRELQPQGHRNWLIAIVVAAASTFVLGIVEGVLLLVNFQSTSAQVLVITSFLVAFVLLVISITDWCEHGALLTSTVVLAYVMWVCYEALAMLPLADGGKANVLPTWIELIICALVLTAFAFSASAGTKEATLPLPEGVTGTAGQAEQGLVPAAAPAEDDDDTPEGFDVTDFTIQCCVHSAAAVFICSALAPARSSATFAARVVAVVLSLMLYCWTLVAPKLLKNREF